MTLKLALSQIKALPFDFVGTVDAFIAAKKVHQSTENVPAPGAPHPWVEQAVRRLPGSIEPPRPDDFVADYEIIDDTPPPPTLDQRKMTLAAAAQASAHAEIDAIDPPLKRRLVGIEAGRAMMVDPSKRTPAQLAAITSQATRDAKREAIIYHLAKLEAQIHDLTDKTIDNWSAAPFPR
jgi:hypothetical protein